MKTTINGYCEIKDGEFFKFGRSLEDWERTTANSIGKLVKCKITIEYDYTSNEPVN